MTDDKQTPVLSGSEKLFKSFSPWIGAVTFCVALYYVLERNQEVPTIVFVLCGVLMGAGKALEMYKGGKS